MPALRKTGIRFPFLPGPLQGDTNPLRQAVIVGALVPSLLLGGNAQSVGRPAPAEDVSRSARAAIVLSVPAPLPSASAWIPRPLLSSEVLTRPLSVQSPTSPVPSASVWLPQIPRTPDLLWPARPLLVAQAPWAPIPGAVALPIGVTHDGDRLPLGVVVYRAVPPPPAAVVWAPTPAREPNIDPRRPIIIAAPWPPLPLAIVQPIGMPRSTPGERVLPWKAVQPPPLPTGVVALALPLPAPRNEIGAQPDRLAPIQVVAARATWPAAIPLLIGWPTTAPTDRLALTGVVGGARPYPSGATVILLAAPRDAVVVAQDRLALTQVVGRAWALPGATTLPIGSILIPADRVPFGGVQIVGQIAPVVGATVIPTGAVRDEGGLPSRVYVVVTASPPAQASTLLIGYPRDTPLAQPDRLVGVVVIRAWGHPHGASALLLGALFTSEVVEFAEGHIVALPASGRDLTLPKAERSTALPAAARSAALPRKARDT